MPGPSNFQDQVVPGRSTTNWASLQNGKCLCWGKIHWVSWFPLQPSLPGLWFYVHCAHPERNVFFYVLTPLHQSWWDTFFAFCTHFQKSMNPLTFRWIKMTPQYCNHNAVFDCSDETGRKWRDGQEGKERLLDQVKWLWTATFLHFLWSRLKSWQVGVARWWDCRESSGPGDCSGRFICWFSLLLVREGLTRKNCCFLDFVQITSPPPPNLDNFYNFFPTSKFKIWKSV